MKSWVNMSFIRFLSLIVLMNPVSPEPQARFPQELHGSAQGSLTYIVDRLTDANPDGEGEGSGLMGDLRYAMTNALSGDSIIFNVTGEIELSSALLTLTQDVNIQGPGIGRLTISGGGSSRVFSVGNGTSIILSNLTISDGVGNGGGILNSGTLTLNNVTVSGNRAGDLTNGGGTGAGIWNYIGGTLTLNNSTVSGNTVLGASFYSPSRGGGIANYGTLTLNNSTVSGNTASDGNGGGIANTLPTSMLTLNNSTVSGNSATGVNGVGSGVDNRGTLNASNTIIAGNTEDDLRGILISQGHNLIGNTAGGSGFRLDLGDLLDVNPLLDSLRDNGGLTQTHALLAGSRAIDQGDNATCPKTDQRGFSRPADSDGKGTAVCDIGAYEFDGIPTVSTATPISVDTLTSTLSPEPVTDTPTPVSADTLTPTLSTEPITDTPMSITEITPDTPSPTSTPTPPLTPCAGAAVLAISSALLIRLRPR